MFDYSGNTWTPVNASDAANDLLARINAILAQNAITNFLRPLISNVIWIFCLAVGQIRAVFDQLLYQAQNSLDIANCSDGQITNLLPIIGTQLITATYTTVWLKVIATSGGSCVVTPSDTLNYNSTISFTPLGTTTILASQTGYVRAICNTSGAIAVIDGSLTSFTTTVSNLSSVVNGTFTVSSILYATVVGRSIETATQLRQRVINGNVIDNSLNGFIRVLQSIQGLGNINVIYNSDNANSLSVTASSGTILIPPRQMWILTQDEDLTGVDVANSWFQYSLIQTYNAGRAQTKTQTVATLLGQNISVYYDTMTTENIYVRVNVPAVLSTLSAANQLLVTNLILTLNNDWTGGFTVTERDIATIFEGFTAFKIYGFDVSLAGAVWTSYVDIYADALPSFAAVRVSFNYI